MKPRQSEFSFENNPPPAESGLHGWRAERERAMEALCTRMALPVGHAAEVRLTQGPVLRGVLRLAEEALWIDGKRNETCLRIGPTTFSLAEIESVIRVGD